MYYMAINVLNGLIHNHILPHPKEKVLHFIEAAIDV